MSLDRRRGFAHVLLGVQALMSLSLPAFYIASRVFDLTGEFDPFGIFFAFIMAVYGVVGYLVVARQPDNPIGLMLCAVGPIWLLSEVGDTYALLLAGGRPLPGAAWAAWAGAWAWVPAMGLIGIFLLILFPEGRLSSRRWRPVVWSGIVGTSLATVSVALENTRLEGGLANPLAVDGWMTDALSMLGLVIFLGSFLAAAASLLVRMKNATGERRQQIKWLMYPAAMVGPLLILAWLSEVFGSACEGGCPSWEVIGAVGWIGMLAMVLLGFPIAIGIAILKYRLYDIDVVINKTLVYGSLAAFITGVYVAVVVGAGTLFGSGDKPNLALSIGATTIVALLFQPVRARVERVANRVVFGARATPYEVMSNLGRDMSHVLAVEDVLPRLAEIAAAAVGAMQTRATLVLPDGAMRSAEWPPDARVGDFDAFFPIADGSEKMGEIAVAKGAGEALTPSDRNLLLDLASEAAVALGNARLAVELRARLDDIAAQAQELKASRERIVAAADLSRRHLERDLESGPERRLKALIADLDAAHRSLGDEKVDAGPLFDGIASRATEALEELRDLARGIFPPLLADKGLVAALDAYFTKLGGTVSLEVTDELYDARFEQDIESTLYFCCVEVLHHVANSRPPNSAVAQLTKSDDDIVFIITGDFESGGQGKEGTGLALTNMTDRLAALGGRIDVSTVGMGTTVRGRVTARELTTVGEASQTSSLTLGG